MKEIQVGDTLFKVKDFLPYSDLDKLNLFSLFTIQAKAQKYKDVLPQKTDGETQPEYVARLEEGMQSGAIKLDSEIMIELASLAEQSKTFDRHIDELLISSPKLLDCRPTTIHKLKSTPEFIQIRANVQEDLEAIMNQDAADSGDSILKKTPMSET